MQPEPGTHSIDATLPVREAQQLLRTVAARSVALTEGGFVVGILDRDEILSAAVDGGAMIRGLLDPGPSLRLRWAA